MMTKKIKMFRSLYWFSFSLLFLTPLSNLGTDIYIPSLPSLVAFFKTDEYLIKSSVTTYLASYGISQLIFGILSDYSGRRKILLLGISIFCIASILVIITHQILHFLFLRMLQGIGAGIISVITKAIISDVYSGVELNNMANYKVTLQITSLVIAPLIGGAIQQFYGWHLNFIGLCLYSLSGILLCFYFIPETCKSKIFKIQILVKESLHVLSDKNFFIVTLATTMIYSIAAVFPVCGSFFIQKVLYYSPLTYGAMALILGICYLCGSMWYKVNKNVKADVWLIVAPICMNFIGITLFINVYIYIFGIALVMFFSGYLLPIIMSYALNIFKVYPGIANALFGTLVMLGTSFTVSLFSIMNITTFINMGIIYCFLSIICFILVRLIIKPCETH